MRRLASIDYAKLAAAVGIVLFHSGAPGAWIGYAGLPFFVMLLVLNTTALVEGRRFGGFLAARARRILLPWVVWSAIYTSFKILDYMLYGSSRPFELSANMLLIGPTLHLWFLPFAFAVSLLLFPVSSRLGALNRLSGQAALGLLTMGLLWLAQWIELPAPFAQWVFVLPSVSMGLAFVVSKDHAAAIYGVACAIVLVAVLSGWTTGLAQFAFASTLLAFCLSYQAPATKASIFASDISLTVYLLHPLIFAVLLRLTGLSHGDAVLATGTIVLTLAVSALGTAWRRRSLGGPALTPGVLGR